MSLLRRRDFIAGFGGAAIAWPLTALAQQTGRMRRVGVLLSGTATTASQQVQAGVKAFTEALTKAGWIEGKNVTVDIRYNAGEAAQARIFAAQLIGLMPDVILTQSTVNLAIVREETKTVPVVFIGVSDPVEQGFVGSLAKPGGNITGFTNFESSVGGKWLDLLKKAAPRLARVAVMINPELWRQPNLFMRSIEAAGSALGISVMAMPVRGTADIEPAIADFAREPNGGLILPIDTFTALRSKLIADMANRHSLPSLSASAEYARDGGLMYYGIAINTVDQYRQAANYVDRILKGEKPGDLPVQNPTRYELTINMKTAKALGLTVPLPLLGLADEVIE